MGTTVREYDLLESLGSGGMGEVFKARHTLLDALFAVKVIHKDLTKNPDIRRRFLQEAKFLAKLDHPGIMRLRNVFDEDDRLYIVTDYLKGETLARVLAQGGVVPLEEGMDWLYQVAAGVDYAHRSGVVHRDLKPANIMVLESGSLQILDFGLAKQFDTGTGGATAPDQFLGTPPYLPPEVLKGDVKLRDIGPEADVYALGVMAYRIFGSALPYGVDEHDSPLRQLSILIRKHLDGAPIEPLQRFRPDLPGEFSEGIMHVLTVPQNARPRSAKTFMELLIRGAATPVRAPAAFEKPPTAEIRAPAPDKTTREIPSLDDTVEIHSPAPAQGARPHPSAPALEDDAPPAPRRGARPIFAVLALVAVAAAAWWAYDRLKEPPRPPFARIAVRVQPDDARISVDGVLVSRSSLHEDSELPAGRHEILVEKTGHSPHRETLDAAGGAAIERQITLAKAFGTLSLETDPPGAAVTVDGKAIEGVTPIDEMSIQADLEHAVVARVDGRTPAALTVAVKENERRSISVALKGFGTVLDIETTPDEVGIWLDGEYVGTTPAEISDVEIDRDVAVRLSRAGYEDAALTVRLAAGERKTIAKTLVRRRPVETEVEPEPVKEQAPPKAEPRVLVVEAPVGKGFLHATASPVADLYVDGKFTGRSTPVMGHPLPVGAHTVVLRTTDGRQQAWQVQVKQGETVRLNKDF